MNHTKEPWDTWENLYPRVIISTSEREDIARVTYIEDAQRIVACVNACAGITNEALEAGVVEWGVNMANDITSGDIWKDGEKVKVWEDV